MKVKLITLVLIVCAVLSSCKKVEEVSTTPVTPVVQDTLVSSFVVMGCNRLDKSDVSNDNPSTANVNQLKRTLEDIEKFGLKPDFFFFAGDIVLGYSPDTSAIGTQLRGWKKLYETLKPQTATYKAVALTGNHEVMSGKNQPAFATAEQTWVNNMKPFIVGNNGPQKNGADKLPTDQSQMTYSFQYKNSTFVILNTDPVGFEGTVPNQWLNTTLTQAKSNAKNKHIFLISHKPAFPYVGEDGLVNSFGQRDSTWNLVEKYRCDAMFSAHNHLYYRTQPRTNGAWQIIAGNGGSPLSDMLKKAEDFFFGFTYVRVYSSGKVAIKSYGRPLPSFGGYTGDPSNTVTTVRDSVDIIR
jgi:hypothetical protein